MGDNKGGGSGRVRRSPSSGWDTALDLGQDDKGNATRDYLEQGFKEWQTSWTSDEQASIQRYREVKGYQAINGALRKQRKMTAKTQSDIDAIDAALSRSRFHRDTILYRGLNTNDLDTLHVGDTFQDAGFASTTTYRFTAELFANGSNSFQQSGQNNVLVRILARKGQRGGFIDKNTGHFSNNEVLLPRGATFKIRSKSTLPPSSWGRGDITYLEVEYL